MKHRQFFGDAEYDFALPVPMIVELEKKTGVGIGALCSRLFRSEFAHVDISETIRLALIGGGLSPERAAGLVSTYVADRPLMESYPIAVAILEARWFGTKPDLNQTAKEEDQ